MSGLAWYLGAVLGGIVGFIVGRTQRKERDDE